MESQTIYTAYEDWTVTESQCRNLWAAVLQQAIVECTSSDAPIRDAARKWIFEPQKNATLGSFPWVCDALDMNPKHLRVALRKKLEGGARIVGVDGHSSFLVVPAKSAA